MVSHLPFAERIYHGSRRSFLVLNRYEAATATPDMPYIVISVADPERGDARLAESPHRRAVLRLAFHDKHRRAEAAGKVVMTAADARRILDFLSAHAEDAPLVVCQCEAGLSRSAAIAAALSRIVQGEDQFFFAHYAPNDYIYHLLLNTVDEGKIKAP